MKLKLGHIVGMFWVMLFVGYKPSFKNGVSMTNETKTIRAELQLDKQGRPFYQLFHGEEMVLDTSYLGVVLQDTDLSKGLSFVGMEPMQTVSDTYSMAHGKQTEITYSANRYTINFFNEQGIHLECQFDVSETGFTYRYRVFGETLQDITITKEVSSYGFSPETKSWMQPMSKAKSGWSETNPSYEEHYRMEIAVNDKSPLGEGYVYPALFQSGDHWLLVSESDLQQNYCGSHLQYNDELKALQVTFPQKEEIYPGGGLLPQGSGSITSPWRTLTIGSLAEIVESTLGSDLAAPAIDMDTSVVKGGLATWSWVLLKDGRIDYETSHQFIDYASDMGWPYTLIDVNWDQKIGYERMKELVDYAESKNVKVILWYNSSGDWNSTEYTPKSKLLTHQDREEEFARLKLMGVAGLKIDFFGGDGQSMIAYYHDMLRDAAKYGLLVNFHGATLPRGWQRTYPNLMTMESIKGEEFITFEQSNADLQPSHCAVIPFARNVYDPMDFTPMVLDSIPNIHRRTTTAFELALPILFTSGIQHIAEIPESMQKMPSQIVELLSGIPVKWDETKFIQGYPGKEIILARRKGSEWYIVGINGEDMEKTWDLDLSFVQNIEGILFYDDGTKIPGIKKVGNKVEQIKVYPHGGFVIKV